MFVNGVFAGAEIAVVSLRSSRLEQLVKEGRGGARAVKRLRASPERFLATVQIGITVVGAVASAFGGATLAADLRPRIAAVPVLAAHAEAIALAVVVALVSYLALVFGELIPKSLALRFADRYALVVARPLLGISWLARPVVWLLTASSNLVLRFFGDSTTFTESRLSPEELQILVDEAAQKGAVDPRAGEIASRAFDFAELTVAQVMVPRGRVVTVPRSAPVEEVRRIILEKGHTRMPVCEGELDNVVGYVSVKDVIALSWERPLFILEDIIRPAYFVVESMSAVTLLEEMKRRRVQLAVVVDEFGALSGIVTLEDLVEELVGEIFSEHDTSGPQSIRREADGAAVADGETPVRDVNRELGLELPDGGGRATIAGLCLELAGRIPASGEHLRAPDGTTLEIADASTRQIRAVRIRTAPPSTREKPDPMS